MAATTPSKKVRYYFHVAYLTSLRPRFSNRLFIEPCISPKFSASIEFGFSSGSWIRTTSRRHGFTSSPTRYTKQYLLDENNPCICSSIEQPWALAQTSVLISRSSRCRGDIPSLEPEYGAVVYYKDSYFESWDQTLDRRPIYLRTKSTKSHATTTTTSRCLLLLSKRPLYASSSYYTITVLFFQHHTNPLPRQ